MFICLDIGEIYSNKNVSGKVVNLDILGQKIYLEDKQGNTIEVEIDNGKIVYYTDKNMTKYEVLRKYVEDNEIGQIMLVENKKKKVGI